MYIKLQQQEQLSIFQCKLVSFRLITPFSNSYSAAWRAHDCYENIYLEVLRMSYTVLFLAILNFTCFRL